MKSEKHILQIIYNSMFLELQLTEQKYCQINML